MNSNNRIAVIITSIILGMVALTFASVPLYRLFCQVTGYDGTPNIDPNGHADRILDRIITVRFNTDVVEGMPWTFRPESEPVTFKIGEKALVSFYAKNNTGQPITGTAIFNVLPENAGPYFHKTQCFCFGKQFLAAHGEAHMPVQFFVDPKIMDDPDAKNIKTITLSFTFFRADSPELDKALDKFYKN
jgi:cytochrome c oxidase assembly protein subunit 11